MHSHLFQVRGATGIGDIRFQDDAVNFASNVNMEQTLTSNKIHIESELSLGENNTFLRSDTRFHVSATRGDDLNNGKSWAAPFRTIKKAASVAGSHTIYVESGTYTEQNPIYLSPNTAVMGDNLRRVLIYPQNNQADMFFVQNACYVSGLRLMNLRRPAFALSFPRAIAECAAVDQAGGVVSIVLHHSPTGYLAPPAIRIDGPASGVGVAATATAVLGANGTIVSISVVGGGSNYAIGERPYISIPPPDALRPTITTSPYCQNCSCISEGPFTLSGDMVLPGSRTLPYPIDDIDVSGGGGGLLVDGNLCQPNSPLKSCVADAFTQVVSGGVAGFRVCGFGFCQLVSCFTTFAYEGIVAASGGVVSVSNSVSDFGVRALVARGYWEIPYTSATVTGLYTSGIEGLKLGNFGFGYATPPSVTLQSAHGSGAVIIATIDTSIAQISVVDGGSGYLVPPTVVIEGASLSRAVASAVLTNGVVTEIKIVEGGTGYASPVSVVLQGASTTTATAVAYVGKVTKLIVTSPGSGYREAPQVVIGAPDQVGGSVATATSVLSGTGRIRINNLAQENGKPRVPDVTSVTKIGDVWHTVSSVSSAGFDAGVGVYNLDVYPQITFVNENTSIEFFHPSIISTGSHVMEHVGAGTTFNALPQYGGIPQQSAQVTQVSPARVFYASVDNEGNLQLGANFGIEQTTGTLTLAEGLNFNVAALSSIGPFRRNGVQVGVALKEVSDDAELSSQDPSTTAPTQRSVKEYMVRRSVPFGGNVDEVLMKYSTDPGATKWGNVRGNASALFSMNAGNLYSTLRQENFPAIVGLNTLNVSNIAFFSNNGTQQVGVVLKEVSDNPTLQSSNISATAPTQNAVAQYMVTRSVPLDGNVDEVLIKYSPDPGATVWGNVRGNADALFSVPAANLSGIIDQRNFPGTLSLNTLNIQNELNLSQSVSFMKSSTRYYVSATRGNDNNHGQNWDKPFKTIEKAASVALNQTIYVESGNYTENAPIFLKSGVAIVGDNLRRTIIEPNQTKNNVDMFHVSNGVYIGGVRIVNLRAPGYGVSFARSIASALVQGGEITAITILHSYVYTTAPAVLIEPPETPDNTGVTATATAVLDANGRIASFTITNQGSGYPIGQSPHVSIPPPDTLRAFVTSSPYVQNSSVISGPWTVTGELITLTPPYDTSIIDVKGSGGGMLVDGFLVNPASPLRSMVADSYTQVSQGGINGFLGTNLAYMQLVSAFTTFNYIGVKVSAGSLVNLSLCVTDFGQFGLVSSGYWYIPYTTGTSVQEYTTTVSALDILASGSGYSASSPPTITISGGSGAGAQAIAVVDSAVAEIVLTTPGTGYTSTPTVSIVGTSTTKAVAVAKLLQGVLSIVLLEEGSGYTSGATLVLTGGGASVQATGQVRIGKVTKILVINQGSGYQTTPAVVIGPPTDGQEDFRARADAVLQGSGSVLVDNFSFENGKLRRPDIGSIVGVLGQWYTITGLTETSTANRFLVSVFPAIPYLPAAYAMNFHMVSTITTGSHTMEYVGSGVSYNALPQFGGVPKPANQIVQYAPGRVYYTTVDSNGNISFGPLFGVEQSTGTLTITSDLLNFNLAGLSAIGPFRRAGRVVGVQLKEVSNFATLTSEDPSTTVPTQFAVSEFVLPRSVPLVGNAGTVLRKLTGTQGEFAWGNLIGNGGAVHSLAAGNISTGTLNQLRLPTTLGNAVTSFVGNSSTLSFLSTGNATVLNLLTSPLSNIGNTITTTLQATTISVSNAIVGGNAIFSTLKATTITVSNAFVGGNATLLNMTATTGNLQSLQANSITSLEIQASNVSVTKVLAPIGPASAPPYTFSSNTDTGIYSPAASVVGLSTSSVERMRIDAQGNVGVGVSNPTYTVDVFTGRDNGLRVTANNAAALTSFNTNMITLKTGAHTHFAGMDLETMFLDARGNVGMLGAIDLRSNAVTKARISAAGMGVIDGTSSAPSISFMSEPGTGMSRPALNTWGVSVAATERLRANATGLFVTGNIAGNTILASNGAFTSNITSPMAFFGNVQIINTIQTPNANVTTLAAQTANISTLNATSFNVSNLFAVNGTFSSNVTSAAANIGALVATEATFVNANVTTSLTANTIISKSPKNYIRYYWDTLAELQSDAPAASWHGMVAHVHETSRMYYAHNSTWRMLADANDLSLLAVREFSVTATASPTQFIVAGLSGANPTISIRGGMTYAFSLSTTGFPFQLLVSAGGAAVTDGVSYVGPDGITVTGAAANTGRTSGTLYYTPPVSAGTFVVYYQCTTAPALLGVVYVDAFEKTGWYTTTDGVNRLNFDTITSFGTGSGGFAWSSSGVQNMTLGSTGILTATSAVRAGVGTAAAPGFAFGSDTTSGIFQPTTSTIAMATAGVERLRVLQTGNVGIAITAPAYTLHVGGPIYSSGDIIAFSDQSVKGDCLVIENALDKIDRLTGYTYKRTDTQSTRRYAGMIANEVAQVLEEATYENVDGTLGLSYNSLIALLVQGMKELRTEIANLKAV